MKSNSAIPYADELTVFIKVNTANLKEFSKFIKKFAFAESKSETITKAFGFGNNETDKDDLYKTDGIISKTFRPVLTAQDGTVFYEVTTVSANVTIRPPGSSIGRVL